MKKRVAISGGRDTVMDFVQGGGGVKLTPPPPPPVKIGLKVYLRHLYIHNIIHLTVLFWLN